MSLRKMVVNSWYLPMLSLYLAGCSEVDDGSGMTSETSASAPAGTGGACNCDCNCSCSKPAATTSSATSTASAVGGNDSTETNGNTTTTVRDPATSAIGSASSSNSTGGAMSAGSNATAMGGNANASSTTRNTVCTDTPRPSESCKDAISWGFCGQAWFAGSCDASCGVCTMGTTGSNSNSASTASNGNSASTASNSNSASTASNSNSASTSSSSSSSASTSSGNITAAANVGARVDNPYAGVDCYVNPEWKAKADAETGGSRISNAPTGVWMDRIAAIDGTGSSATMGLRDHLDEAIAQGVGCIQVVIYNLPGRDCAALSSNGELGPTELGRYKTEYIDPIATIESDAKYASLRIINIIEIDSLPNLVTNTGSSDTATAACDVMKANGNYEKGIAYALGTLYKAGNTYNYIDAGHHGWIGWDDNFNDSAALFAQVAKSADGGVDTVTGFITNTANYSALEEPFIQATEATRQSKWIDFNKYVDEKTFATAFRTKLVSLGLNSNIGMLIDTSRNGWGGPDRPAAASTATDVDAMIDESRIDRRIHLGNWCNQSGAGLGERPKVVDSGGIDAYVWIKPPGESDGASQFVENDQGKGVDGMCDPTYAGNARNGNNLSGALGDAPLSGAWFSAQFQELMANAYPPL